MLSVSGSKNQTLNLPPANKLRVGGLLKLSTIDYPGQLSAVIFCQGCPIRCAFCHNQHLWSPRSDHLIPWPEIIDFLYKRIGLLDAVVFSGGEPLAQGALTAAIIEVKSLGFKIGLHTSGYAEQRLIRVLSLIDWVCVSPKDLIIRATNAPSHADQQK